MPPHSEMTPFSETAISLVKTWILRASELESSADRVDMEQLEQVVSDAKGLRFVMKFVDRVVRPDSNPVAARQFLSVAREEGVPSFLSTLDKCLFNIGRTIVTWSPGLVMPATRWRMRGLIGNLVAPAEPKKLAKHLKRQRKQGYALNVNLLGEAVLGEKEASGRLEDLLTLLEEPDVDYVSVKISSLASQLNHWAYDDSLRRVAERVRILLDKTLSLSSATFVNFDMEEYHDLELTLDATMKVLGEVKYQKIDAGIVLQAYLPDALPALQRLTKWANQRYKDGGGQMKVRLVKGANLAMEKVDAAMHGWKQAPFDNKVETDANYKRCLEWLLCKENMTGVRLGLASHNLFDIAWVYLLAEKRGVRELVQFEMLQGMAPAYAKTIARAVKGETSLLLYTPAVREEDFDVAISYLFRRLEENASEDNFLRHLFTLKPDSLGFIQQAELFKKSLQLKDSISIGARRKQNRLAEYVPPYVVGEAFLNEPESDPSLPLNRKWIAEVLALKPSVPVAAIVEDVSEVENALERARNAFTTWRHSSAEKRQSLLHQVGIELGKRRSELIATMREEAKKTFAEADVEIAEAIDFARYYGDRARDIEAMSGATFSPLGVIAVIPPWNFAVAISAGGVLAALGAGNTVLFKPAPETPRCAEIVAEACFAAGIPKDVLQFIRTPDNDVGQHLVTHADAVILTGGTETANLFRSWKPTMTLFAETSGKNALIISPNADMDLAVADLARSAFGHNGQKCSAASLCILVGDAYDSKRMRRQLKDAVESLNVGLSDRIETNVGPIISQPNPRLMRALTTLEEGESWLVEPKCLDRENHLWSPGVRDGVQVGSWFHKTECFGPVLGLMRAKTLEEAIEIQNASVFGLTGGLHSLDPKDIEVWEEKVQVGNAYVNRAITGAIVQRQPFGGWKRSSIGPGAKAGGPNYMMQLGDWTDDSDTREDYQESWDEHFSKEHDPTKLFCESNVFRYRPLERVVFRIGKEAKDEDIMLAHKAASICGVEVIESFVSDESNAELAKRLPTLKLQRIRMLGAKIEGSLRTMAQKENVHLVNQPVSRVGRIELLHYLREQAVSKTLHRFGNLVL